MDDTSAARGVGMRLLVAPCSFKGSLGAEAAAEAIGRGAARVSGGLLIDACPIADGGEGTAAVLATALGGALRAVAARDPLGRSIQAHIAALPGGVFVVESAEAAGLGRLASDERDPLRATSHGVADMIRAALDAGASEIIVALGGSATVDGGLGLLAGLGAIIMDSSGRVLRFPADLDQVDRVGLSGLDPRLADVRLVAACDVGSPLSGARRFMRQKGADRAGEERLHRGLTRLGEALRRATGRDVAEVAGAGAAGGLGAALAALGARMESGADLVLRAVGADARVAAADLVLTGEGRVDEQTGQGKAIAALAGLCRAHARPLVALCGAREGDLSPLHAAGVTAVFPLVAGPMTEVQAMASAPALLESAAEQVVRLWAWGR